MASTYSPSLRAELIGSGDQSGTWGSTTNNNFQYIFEAAIAGYQTVAIAPTSNNQVLTYTNGPTSTGSADQSVYAILKLNASAVSANFNLFAPPASKQYTIWNNTAYTATFYNSTVIGNTTAAGSGAVIPAGAKVWIWSDGTSFYGNDTAVGNFNVAGNLAVTGTATFTGIPSGPTAAAGTNTTQLATTAFVTTAVSNAFPSGTRLVFAQASAPTGWTQDTSDTANNRMIRVVNSTGGGVAGTSDPTIMNVVPSHTHGVSSSGSGATAGAYTGIYDSGHAHSIPIYGETGGSQNTGGASVSLGSVNTNAASANISDPSHAHNFSVTVSGTTDNGSSQTNWTPRYNNVIICQKN